jgi:ankyrin repeat protein
MKMLPILVRCVAFVAAAQFTFVAQIGAQSKLPDVSAQVTTLPDELALIRAAHEDNSVEVKDLLAKHVRVNVTDGDGMTPLHWAAYNDDLELGELLLRRGAFPEPRTRVEGITPLILAAGNGSTAFIDLLLKANAQVNVADDRGGTPLMMAAAAGNTGAIGVLLAHGADLNAHEAAYGQTALFFAASHDRADAVRLLLAKGADSTVKTSVAKLARVNLSANFDSDPTADGAAAAGGRQQRGGPQAAAAGNSNDAAAPRGPSEATTAQGEVPLLPSAARQRGANAADAGPNGSAGGNGPLRGNGKQIASNTEGGAALPNARFAGRGGGRGGFGGGPERTMGGLSALHVAARDGEIDAVIALLDGHDDINRVTDSDHATPLVLALINGHFDVAKLLLERGADPKLVSTDGVGPLYALFDVQWSPHTWYPQPVTAQENTSYLDLASELIAHGADLNARLTRKLWYRVFANDETWIDVSGATPFFRAALAGDLAAMKLLVAKGADPAIATTGGDTPLMAVAGVGWAAYWTANAPYSRLEGATFCLDHGSSIDAKDSKGYTALHGAAFRGDNDLVKYLVAHGADAKARSTQGDSTADVANGLFEHAIPHPDTVALLEQYGSTNAHDCRSNECVVAPKEGGGVFRGGGSRGSGTAGGDVTPAKDSSATVSMPSSVMPTVAVPSATKPDAK